MTKVLELLAANQYTHAQTVHLILGIDKPRVKVAVLMLYLTGCRREELCKYAPPRLRHTRKTQLTLQPDNTIRKDIKPNVENNPNYGKIGEPMQKKDIFFEEDSAIVSMRTLKNKKVKFRKVPIPLEREPELVAELRNFLDNVPEQTPIYPFTSRYLYTEMKKYAPQLIRPHFLRSLRTQHLKEVYGFEPEEIKFFNGWSDLRPLASYSGIFNVDKLKEKMLHGHS